MSGPTAEELEAVLAKAGGRRLDAALKQLGFDRSCDAYFREELLTAIRKFAVMTGDLELEAGCDAARRDGVRTTASAVQRPDLLRDMGAPCPTAPERIWLQSDPEPEEDGKPVYPANPSQDDVTWCVDQINASDTLYVRADKVLELLSDAGALSKGAGQ